MHLYVYLLDLIFSNTPIPDFICTSTWILGLLCIFGFSIFVHFFSFYLIYKLKKTLSKRVKIILLIHTFIAVISFAFPVFGYGTIFMKAELTLFMILSSMIIVFRHPYKKRWPKILSACIIIYLSFHILLAIEPWICSDKEEPKRGLYWGKKNGLISIAQASVHLQEELLVKRYFLKSFENEDMNSDLEICNNYYADVQGSPNDPFRWGNIYFAYNVNINPLGYSGGKLKTYIDKKSGYYAIWSVGPDLISNISIEEVKKAIAKENFKKIEEKTFQDKEIWGKDMIFIKKFSDWEERG